MTPETDILAYKTDKLAFLTDSIEFARKTTLRMSHSAQSKLSKASEELVLLRS